MYRLAITRDFIAQHFLIGGDWGAENFKHSHHYKVELLLRGASLNSHGYLADIVELESALQAVISRFSDRTLNELEPFADLNPSLERFAKVLYEDLCARLSLGDVSIAVKLWENDRDWASYGGE
jgi:6-pyruvoyltetrahydropterin/6-carboxytetrahydropterin synthase